MTDEKMSDSASGTISGAIVGSVAAAVVADAVTALQKQTQEAMAAALVGQNNYWSNVAAVSGAISGIASAMATPAKHAEGMMTIDPVLLLPPRDPWDEVKRLRETVASLERSIKEQSKPTDYAHTSEEEGLRRQNAALSQSLRILSTFLEDLLTQRYVKLPRDEGDE